MMSAGIVDFSSRCSGCIPQGMALEPSNEVESATLGLLRSAIAEPDTMEEVVRSARFLMGLVIEDPYGGNECD